MSLILAMGTQPAGVEIKTFGIGSMRNTVYLGESKISLEDFLVAAEYVLTNTDLEPNDPRLQFVKNIQSMKEVEGYNSDCRRLKFSESTPYPSQSQ